MLCSFTLLFVAGRAEAQTCAPLGNRIEAIFNRPELSRLRWGLLVQTVPPAGSTPQTLYAHDAEQLFIPASNAKLLTTAAALEALGPSYQIRTSVYSIPTPAAGLTIGLVGRGDPGLSDVQLTQLAQQIRDRGITQIQRLLVDNHYFQGDSVNPSWEWEDIQAGYGAPVNSLMLNQNQIGLTLLPQAIGQPLRIVWDNPREAIGWRINNQSQTVAPSAPEFVEVGRDLQQPVLQVRGQLRAGSASEPVAISIPDPDRWFIQHLQQALATRGIQVNDMQFTATPIAPSESEIAFVNSLPVAQLLRTANQESNNLYAESLLRTLGKASTADAQAPTLSALEAGLEALKLTLTRIGVRSDDYQLVDGSGLSRHNLVSPAAVVQTLQAMAHSNNASVYRASLSVAGSSGTLQHRFLNTPVAGHLHGKTGFLSGAMALSGYLDRPDGSTLAFSLIVNQFNQPSELIQHRMDEAVATLLSESCSK